MLCEITSVGFCAFCMTFAIVNVFPDPVTPKRAWCSRFFVCPSVNLDIAWGWSPAGLNLEEILNIGKHIYRILLKKRPFCGRLRYMFSYLNGIVTLVSDKYVVVDVNGIGYRVYIPERVKNSISEIGKNVKLFTHTVMNVNEGSFDIYGFTDPNDLHIFLLLTSVSGVGPASAGALISSLDAGTIQSAILSEDHEYLSRVPRVGKKTAQRIILELKNKVGVLPGADNSGFRADTEALDALVALGYSKFQAQKALNVLPKTIKTSEEKIKEALKILGNQ